ncbi:TetR/AcrR family transcriptional regulator C-terminal domain-containing protein [Erwinia oleae]|uniref:TetR/AcrR family transcriptional regulator C-terminal domain-containing protein n=1 Tax=Erwinia oleae TaxID=796334 RepID=UPI00055542A5|nr:TetR/AcrR family transcriptional regulator C-terminal domain-containing protein [Erwinia oleae]
MAKIRREEVIDAGLELLNETGLEALTMRKLALRLNVEAASLYWHFKDKTALLNAMASAIVLRHHRMPVAGDPTDWARWYTENFRSFRAALLTHRDGAKLHAATAPSASEFEQILPKIDLLVAAGFDDDAARMALLAGGQFTMGSVLEEQAQGARAASAEADPGEMTNSFDFGLSLLVAGLRSHLIDKLKQTQAFPQRY